MAKDKFLNIELEEPPIELQLSVEMRIREVLKSDDYVGVKRYCTHLIRHQMSFLLNIRSIIISSNQLIKLPIFTFSTFVINFCFKFFYFF